MYSVSNYLEVIVIPLPESKSDNVCLSTLRESSMLSLVCINCLITELRRQSVINLSICRASNINYSKPRNIDITDNKCLMIFISAHVVH